MSRSSSTISKVKFVATASTVAALCAVLVGCIVGGEDVLISRASASPVEQTMMPGRGITVYAAGDIADCGKLKPEASGAAKTAGIIEEGSASDKNAVVLALGDIAYPTGLLADFTDCYDPTWGRFKNRTYPAPGNHEYYTPAAVGYYTYFGSIAGPARRGYYSIDLGKWHIVSLNSNLTSTAQLQLQLDWLKTDLAEHPVHCTLAYWHHPLYSSGGHGNNDRMADLWQVLQDGGVDIVLSGHDHDYERFAPQDAHSKRDDAHGIRQFVVGTGGAHLTPFLFQRPNSEVRDNSTAGVLRLTLKEAGYEWEFIPVTGGSFTDRGAALCH